MSHLKDLQLEDGDLCTCYDIFLVTGIDRIAQQIAIKLRFFTQDFYLNKFFGVPYYEQVFVKDFDFGQIENTFKLAILEVQDVDELISFDMNFDNAIRKLVVQFKVRTLHGEISLLEELP